MYYNFHRPSRGDVIVFWHCGVRYIKRIVGTPGQGLWLFDFIGSEGDKYSEVVPPEYLPSYVKAARTRPDLGRIHFVRVPQDGVFVVGDGGTTSVDSRDFGPIKLDDIEGGVVPPRPAPHTIAGR
jgi:signal peptidase I